MDKFYSIAPLDGATPERENRKGIKAIRVSKSRIDTAMKEVSLKRKWLGPVCGGSGTLAI